MASNQLNGAYQEIALTADRKFTSLFPTKVTPGMIYNDVTVGPGGMRQRVETVADSGTDFTYASNKIVFQIKSQGVLDFKHAQMKMRVSATQTGGTVPGGTFSFTKAIWNLFTGVRVLSNGSVVTYFNNKNLIRSLQYSLSRSPSVDASIGDACWGTGPIGSRESRVGGYWYLIPLDIAWLVSDELPFMDVTNFTIEFELAPPQWVVQNGTQLNATYNYTISNPVLEYDEVFYQPDLMAQFRALKVIVYPFTNYKVSQFNIPAGSNVNQFNVPIKVQGVKRFLAIMKDVADLGDPTKTDYWTGLNKYNNSVNYQLTVDNYNYPQQPVKAGATNGVQEAYHALWKAVDRYESETDIIERRNNGETGYLSINDFPITLAEFTSNMFCMAIDVKTFSAHSEQILTKFDTTSGNTSVIFKNEMGPGMPANNTVMFIITIHSSVVTQIGNGTFSLIE